MLTAAPAALSPALLGNLKTIIAKSSPEVQPTFFRHL
jgi:hypothetical protein